MTAPEVARDRLETAVALHRSGHRDAAEAIYAEVLADHPDHPDALHFLGLLRFEQGRPEDAAACIRSAIAGRPDDAGFHFNLGNILRETGRPEEAVAAYRRAAELAPQEASVHNNLGNTLFDLSRYGDAIAAFERAIALQPNLAAACVNLGCALREIGATDDAEAAFRRALAIDGGLAEAQVGLGQCRQRQGDFEAATASFRRALEIDPDGFDAISNLLQMGPVAADDPLLPRLEALADNGRLPHKHRIAAQFVLGKVRDDWGDYDAAFARFRLGNALQFADSPYDAAEIEDLAARSKTAFGHNVLTRFGGRDGGGGVVPIFVLGMPRSGTTMVERILTSHPAVQGGGESGAIEHAADHLQRNLNAAAPYPECVADLDRDTASALAAAYIGQFDDLGGATHVTDKMPDNFRWLGLIAVLFPNARVVHCRRHPLDTCLSCYFQLFKEAHAYAYDLAALGAYYRAYDDLMAHWRKVLPLDILDLDYEDLVADQEGVSRGLIDFCGLAWDDRCLRFHEQAGEVRTASYWQARQPVYARSVGRWRHYAAHIGPLRAALGDLARG
jgi:tetratricopeptide (TPR) repeat protein